MARINDLLRQLERTDAGLAAEIQREYDAVADRRAFGLNFERHTPEAVELPGRPVRRGDKVHVLPPRGETPKKENHEMWMVESIDKSGDAPVATIVRESGNEDLESQEVPVEDLVVVAEFRDPIYPGLVSTGKVERGGDKPYHSVINGENFHALEALLFTHRGKVDAIYIDPPYNTGARDWKYNNDYVESDDMYRHSKWLAFMERRLKLAKELLNPDDSVLIVTIDEKEYLRLGLLLQQLFPEMTFQMITSMTNKKGSTRPGKFARSEEYIFFGYVGGAVIALGSDNMMLPPESEDSTKKPQITLWNSLLRRGTDALRADRPNMFYPVFINGETKEILRVGDPLQLKMDRKDVVVPPDLPIDTLISWPMRKNGVEGRWQIGAVTLRQRVSEGRARAGEFNKDSQQHGLVVIKDNEMRLLEEGQLVSAGRDRSGSLQLEIGDQGLAAKGQTARTIWVRDSHDASIYGSTLLREIIPGRKFPFPKSLYAVEDALRFFLTGKPTATVVDFFSGSGTTAHAVMRLNKQDGGNRVCISVTNNEVSADEQKELRKENLRQGDPGWEKLGICDFVTKPRIAAAITGMTPEGDSIKGDYKFTDKFPMADGFAENVEFFTLTYESSLQVSAGRAFDRIAPLLWLRAGSRGLRIKSVPGGWAVADTYGVLMDMATADAFVEAILANASVTLAFIVTDEDKLFETVSQQLPDHVEPVRLYEAYLRNFERDALRITR